MLLSTVNSWQVQGKLTPDLRAQATTLLLLTLSQVLSCRTTNTEIIPDLASLSNWEKLGFSVLFAERLRERERDCKLERETFKLLTDTIKYKVTG